MFSTEEIQAAIDQFLLQQVKVPRLKTGARNVVALRDQVYDLLTTALLLRPDSFFYLVWLSKNRLQSLVKKQIDSLNAIDEYGADVTRSFTKVRSTAELSNAEAALLSLNAGLGSRDVGVSGSIGPAVDRFRRSVERFVNTELTKNVVQDGDVVETADELRLRIAKEWADVVERQDDVSELSKNLSGAVSALGKVRLPERAVRDIVARIQQRLTSLKQEMEGDDAAAKSRTAMLDLLVMRTLLARASNFRTPVLKLMPLTGDSTTLSFIDGDGTEAALTGNVSGPFNYDPGTTFDVSVNGGSSTPSVTLPRTDKGSRAELRSRPFTSFPEAGPTLPAWAAFEVDFSSSVAANMGLAATPWASGTAMASDLNTLLGSAVDVTWDATTEQLVFQSNNSGDASALEALIDDADRQRFVEWAFQSADDSYPLFNKGEPVPIEEVLDAISASSPDIDATAIETFITSFIGEKTSVGGEERTVWHRVDSGSDLQSDDSVVVLSPSKNLDRLGVKAGMKLIVTASSPPGVPIDPYTIVEVDGNRLTLDQTIAAATLTYYIGPDYSTIPVGARVQVTGDRRNTGFYRVASGHVARIVVDRDLEGAAESELSVSVFTEYVSLAARGTTTTSGIGVLSPSGGATALGFSVSATEDVAELLVMQLTGAGDFLARGVKVGDRITLTSPSSASYVRDVAEVTTNRVTLSEAVPYEAGNWSFVVESARYLAYVDLQAALDTWMSTTYEQDFAALDRLVGRVIRGARYVGTEIETAVEQYRDDLVVLQTALDAYIVPFEKVIDGVVKTMAEQGFDRALDLLTEMKIETFFTMEPDGVSYKTNLIRQAATTTREVAPVSKYAKSDRVIQEVRPVSFQPDPFDPTADLGE